MEFLPATAVDVAALQGMTTEQLRGELARSLQLNAEQLLHLAAVWRVLESRGEDLSDLRTGMGVYLPMIASGRLDASVVVQFAGQSTLLRALSDVPVERQRAIASGEKLRVIALDKNGNPEPVEVAAYALTAAQVRQVFAPGKLRDEQEQSAVLMQTTTRKRQARVAAGPRVRFDPATDHLVIGRTRISAGEVLAALVQSSDAVEDGDDVKTVLIKVSETEHRALRMRAAEGGSGMAALAKMAMRRAGLLG